MSAELYKIYVAAPYCPPASVPLALPIQGFAIPFAHYVDHFEASGARALLAELEQDPAFRADPETHVKGLESVRKKILDARVDPELLKERRRRDRLPLRQERVPQDCREL